MLRGAHIFFGYCRNETSKFETDNESTPILCSIHMLTQAIRPSDVKQSRSEKSGLKWATFSESTILCTRERRWSVNKGIGMIADPIVIFCVQGLSSGPPSH